MAKILRTTRKELASFFSSLAAFIFIGAFLAACLFIFFWVSRFFARNIADVRPLFEWMPVLLIFLVSAMTMRMWSEERRSGTLEFLMTLPVSPLQLVLGKFLAGLVLTAIALGLTLPIPTMVALIGPLDWGPVIGGYVAALALAAAYISIGLYVSSRTDNQIVSLIVTVLICGIFYLLGSSTLTSLVGNEGGTALRLLGTGSRFDSIARGVIDLRDLYYYLSIFGVFLTLNLYALERVKWSTRGRSQKHLRWEAAAVLAALNMAAGNLWLGQLSWARIDLTAGHVYSISDETRSYLRQLREPLLIRGYFSAETHPLLAPLVPRLHDLLREYEIAGAGKVRVEFVDPTQDPKQEAEANSQYNIRSVPFQTANKYQEAVTNSYFDILVKYGDEFTTLGYRDLIEIKQRGEEGLDVDLRDPEYEITRALKKVLTGYRGGGDVLASLPDKVTLEAYVSDESLLPKPLPQLKADLAALIQDYETKAPEKFDGKITDPGAADSQTATMLRTTYGLRPLAAGLLDPKQFWFDLIMRSGGKAEQVQLPDSLDKEGLKRAIDDELKRFVPGALRSVALYTPPGATAARQLNPGGPTFQVLATKLRENASVLDTDLQDGKVPEQADALIVAAPDNLNAAQIFAIDQFLMKGGTVVIATSPFAPSLASHLEVTQKQSGLKDWLAFHGLTVSDKLVLDPQDAPFPVPMDRNIGGVTVRDIKLMQYPYFVDVRQDGFAEGQAPTSGLRQLTVPWASPVAIGADKAKSHKVTDLIRSSTSSWTSDSHDLIPDFAAHPATGFAEGKETGRQTLSAMMEGEFTSFFAGKPSPLAKDAAPPDKSQGQPGAKPPADTATITGVIEKSPESARIILIGSAAFLSDEFLDLSSSVDQTNYLAPVEFAQNLVDWSLEDRGLLALRNRGGAFARTLDPIDATQRLTWEYVNYALALAGLGLVFGIRRATRVRSRRKRLTMLGLDAAGA